MTEGKLRSNPVPLQNPRKIWNWQHQVPLKVEVSIGLLKERVSVCLRNRSSDRSLSLYATDQIFLHQPIQILEICSLEIENRVSGLGENSHGWEQGYCTKPSGINRMFIYQMLRRFPNPPQSLFLITSKMKGARAITFFNQEIRKHFSGEHGLSKLIYLKIPTKFSCKNTLYWIP